MFYRMIKNNKGREDDSCQATHVTEKHRPGGFVASMNNTTFL
jgi:hypothetical protein